MGDDGPRYETVVIIRFLLLSMISFERRSPMIWSISSLQKILLVFPTSISKEPIRVFSLKQFFSSFDF